MDSTRPFKLSMDRVFSMKGFGTVVTGTVSSGVLGSDDELRSQDGSTMKVRGIQVHGESVEKAGIGNRTAISVIGVEKAELGRRGVGSWRRTGAHLHARRGRMWSIPWKSH